MGGDPALTPPLEGERMTVMQKEADKLFLPLPSHDSYHQSLCTFAT